MTQRLILGLLAFCITAPGLRGQTRGDTTAVLRLIAAGYRDSDLRIGVVADSGSDRASRAALAALLEVPRQPPTDSTLPECSWLATPQRRPRGVEATLERFELGSNQGHAVVSVVCAQPGAAIGDIYFMRREFRFRKARGRWRLLPGGRVQVTQAGDVSRRDRPTIAEAYRGSLLMLASLAPVGQPLQLSSGVRPLRATVEDRGPHA